MKICIDPGHGGHDSGADGPTGLTEAETVLAMSQALSYLLVGYQGVVTMLTRTTDVFVALGKRCELANEWGADYFVSVHLNSNGPKAVGIETLYTTNKGMALAIPVQVAMIAATGDTDRGLKERNDLYVLNGTAMPAILTEGGFISHPATETKLKTKEYRQTLADAMCRGIVGHLVLKQRQQHRKM